MSDLWVCSRWNTAPKEIEKLKVMHEGAHTYHVEWDGVAYSIPKDHYIPCPAPEQWEQVEVALEPRDDGEYVRRMYVIAEGNTSNDMIGALSFNRQGYRVVSLVVERRTS